jgi:hypothetical protein
MIMVFSWGFCRCRRRGTHAFLAAEVGAYSVGEPTLARRLYPRLHADELLTADTDGLFIVEHSHQQVYSCRLFVLM